MNLIDIIDGYGINNGESIAHVYCESKLTYKELKEKSDALAAFLIYRYGEDKTPVVVFGHKQHEMLISFIACVKAGHAYIPVDSSLPYERIRDIVKSSKTKLIINIDNNKINFDNNDAIDINDINNISSKFRNAEVNKSYRVKEEDTYYIIYTSGSTGNPKGVQITLSCLESFVKWGLELCEGCLNNRPVFMNQAPFSFDLSVMDLYLSLASGSTLFSIDKAMISNLKLLFENFKKSDISVWVSTPSFAEMCLADKSFNSELLPRLGLFLFCGETLTNSCVSKLHERFEQGKVINTYGPTEATVAVTSVEVTKEISATVSPLPVGKVKSDCKIVILNREGKEVPEGEKGEITIIGDSVSIGYYGNEEMSKKVFAIYNLNGNEKRGYRTGDEGFIKGEMLYYSGRIDFQIKLNGYRIEIEDIESNFRKVDVIKNAVVVPVFKEGKVQYLSAAILLNTTIYEKEFKIVMMIKNELRKFLPEYMIPRKIVIKDALPMTTNGKVNRKSLMEEMQ